MHRKAVDVFEIPVIFAQFPEEAVGPFHIVAGRAAGDQEQSIAAEAAHERSVAAELGAVIFG